MLNYHISVCPDLKNISFVNIVFKVHMSKIGIDESEKLCWKHEIFIFQKLNIGRCICRCVSALQYNTGENTDMYVHIVAS